MDHTKMKTAFEQYQEGAIHGVEMVDAALSALTADDLREMVANGERFDRKLGLDPLDPSATTQGELQKIAARLVRLACGLLAEVHAGYVPTITCAADGTIMLVELLKRECDSTSLPTTSHILREGF